MRFKIGTLIVRHEPLQQYGAVQNQTILRFLHCLLIYYNLSKYQIIKTNHPKAKRYLNKIPW